MTSVRRGVTGEVQPAGGGGVSKSVSFSLGTVADHAEIAARRPGALESTLLRTRSRNGRVVLGHLATQGRGHWDQLLDLAERYRDPVTRRSVDPAVKALDPEWVAAAARVMALQFQDPRELDTALSLYAMVVDHHKARQLKPVHSRLYGQLLLAHGRDDELSWLLEHGRLKQEARSELAADLVNPWRPGSSASDPERWLDAFNAVVSPIEEPVTVDGAAPTPFDGLGVSGALPQREGPLISVVMSAYHPGADLLTSLRSMLAQTWTSFEVIVVDDGSGPEYSEVLHAAAALDDRVRLIRCEVNRGTYAVRNTALEAAAGEFVTFQDSDDWSHPRRLERQVEPLLSDPGVIATRSWCARAYEDLTLSSIGYTSLRPNASSLMFRRAPVLDRIGYFDHVRKAADSEYHRRIEAAFDTEVTDLIDSPLAVVRLRAESLSRSDFAPGWHHKSRFSYRMGYLHWHRRIAAGLADPKIGPTRDDARRAFPAPATFVHGRHLADQPVPHYDVVFAGEWRKYGGPQRSMMEEIHALLAIGKRVGVCHLEALRFMHPRDQDLCAPLMELVADGRVDLVLLDDVTSVDTLIIRYPPVLQFTPDVDCRLRPRAAILVANQAPYERDGSDQRYDVRHCMANARELFGIDPRWVAQGPTVQDILGHLVPSDLLAAITLPGIIDVGEWETDRDAGAHRPARIGRYSRDDPMKFPEGIDRLLAAYPPGDTVVQIMGGTNTLPKLLDRSRWPDNWVVTAHGSRDVGDFLSDLDFFVYYDHPAGYEAFGRSILEALAAGCVVVLPEKHRATFGSSAVYAEPEEVADVVSWFAADPDRYRTKSRAARSYVRRHFGRAAFLDRLERLTAGVFSR